MGYVFAMFLISVEIWEDSKSVLPYIWANLELKSIVLIKGPYYQKVFFLHFMY